MFQIIYFLDQKVCSNKNSFSKMVKFADLHKSVDDAFNKDFVHGKFNVEHKQAFDGGDLAKGTITYKLDHSPIVGSTGASVEAKGTMGPDMMGLKCLDGIQITEKWTDGNVNMKLEKSCASSGAKFTYDYNFDWNKQSVDKVNFAIDYCNANATLGLKATASGENACMKVPGNINAHVTTAMAGHNLGCNLNYNVASGKADHHLKFKLNHGQGYAVVGMKNANDTELLVAQNLNKNICLGPVGNFKINNVYAKVNYAVSNGEYAAGLSTEGDY